MNKPVITNLRINKHDWLQIKAFAAELGMSVNEYVNYLIRDLSIKRELLLDMKPNRAISRKMLLFGHWEILQKGLNQLR